MGLRVIVSLFLSLGLETKSFSRVLDNRPIFGTKDSRRFFVDVDFGIFKCVGIRCGLSRVGWFR